MTIKSVLSQPGTLIVACTMLFANSVTATSISAGTANIDGSVTVTLNSINFFGNTGVVPNVFNVDSGTGSFSGLTTPNSIKDLTGGPVTGNTSVIGFATFTTSSGLITFDLTHIDPGTGTLGDCQNNTVGNTCTPTGSPFTLTQVSANAVGFTFSLEGFAYTGSSSTGESAAQALFTGQQVPGTITGILNALQTTGSFNNSYSAAFSAVAETPEPGTFATFLIGTGLIGFAVVRRHRQAF